MNYKLNVSRCKISRTIVCSADKDNISKLSKTYINELKNKKDLHESRENTKYKKARKSLLENRQKSFETLKSFIHQLYISEIKTIKNVLEIYTNENESLVENTEDVQNDIDEKHKYDSEENNSKFDI